MHDHREPVIVIGRPAQGPAMTDGGIGDAVRVGGDQALLG
jgi:hypothetical protein